MHSDLITFIQKCESCQKLKNPTGHLRIRAPYIARPNPTKPWDVISTDVMQLSESNEGNKWVLIFVDTFSRFIEAVPLSTVNGFTVGETLVHQIICRHGCPSFLICDNAPTMFTENFQSYANSWASEQLQSQHIIQKQTE